MQVTTIRNSEQASVSYYMYGFIPKFAPCQSMGHLHYALSFEDEAEEQPDLRTVPAITFECSSVFLRRLVRQSN